jgi:Putative restriction endonuclease
MSAISTISRAPSPQLPLYRFTPEQFQRLIASDVLAPDQVVELHDGQVVVRNNGSIPPLQFTVAQYQRMITLGIVPEDTPAELLDGLIVTKMSRNAPHDSAVYCTHMALIRLLPPTWICRGQSGVTTDDSQPEPDLAVVQGPPTRYRNHHPTAQETALVIEASDSTLDRDRGFKGPLYARSGIPIYWILNIPDDWIEVYTEPATTDGEPLYQQRQVYRQGESVPVIVAGSEIAMIPVQELLVPPE